MGLPRPDMDGDVRNDPARPEQRRRTAGRAQGRPQGEHLLGQVEELHRLAEIPRPDLRLRPGDLRRECLRRHRRNRPDMRVLRRGSGSALPPGQFAQLPAHPHPARPGYGGTIRQRGQNQRFDLRRRGRLPGRGRCGMCHGRRRGMPAFRRHPFADRIRRGDGARTPPGAHLRPRMRIGTGALHRTQCDRGSPGFRCQCLRHALRRLAHGELRPGRGGDERDRA